MLKNIYSKHQYFFNLLVVLVLMTTIRTFDWLVWTPAQPDKTKLILINHLFEFLSFLPIVSLLIYSYQWALKKKHTLLFLSLIIIFSVCGPSLVKVISYLLKIIFLSMNVQPITLDMLILYSIGGFVYFLLLSMTYYLTHLRFQYTKQKVATYKAETLTKEVQLKMLRYQINPHFLFNVLNSIHALIDENTAKAKKLVIEMSEYYRYTLNKQNQTISIENEVEAIIKYLEIQKIRFEDKFEYEISVEETTKTLLIPSFVIHLLIENAVKYGILSNEQKLQIHLLVKLSNKRLLINVSNTGKLIYENPLNNKNKDGTGNGIENITNRLALFYQDNYSFSLKEENGWVVAGIEIYNIQT